MTLLPHFTALKQVLHQQRAHHRLATPGLLMLMVACAGGAVHSTAVAEETAFLPAQHDIKNDPLNTSVASGLSAPATLDFDQARQRMRASSHQLAGAQAATESKRLQAQGLQSLGGPIVTLSGGATSYRVQGEVDTTGARQYALQQLQQPVAGVQLPPSLMPLLPPIQQQVGNSLSHAIPNSVPYKLRDTTHNQGVTVVWPVYTGGLFTAIKRFGSAQQAEAQADASTTAHQLDSLLVQRYFGVQLARRAAFLRRQVTDTIGEHDRVAERLMQVGMIARVDRLQASVALEDARRQSLKAQGDAALAQAALQNLLQLPQPVVLATPLFLRSQPLEPLAHFQDLAWRHHPGLDKIAAKKQQAEQLHAMENAQWKPSVALFGRRELDRNGNWVAGVQASWTLWSALDRRSMEQASAQKVLQADHADAQARSDIALLVEKNWRAVEDARQQYLALTPGVQLAQEMMRLRSAGLREGTSTLTDLIDAHTNYTKVETERAKAAFDYVTALAQLLESAGIPEQFDGYQRTADIRIAPQERQPARPVARTPAASKNRIKPS